MASRTPRQIVTVEGREGQFLQVSSGAKQIRVKRTEGSLSFLVPANTVTKVVSFDSAEKPVRAGMISLKRATYDGKIVIIVRSGKNNSRICEIGGTTTFVVANGELSDHHEAVPAVEETVADSDSAAETEAPMAPEDAPADSLTEVETSVE